MGQAMYFLGTIRWCYNRLCLLVRWWIILLGCSFVVCSFLVNAGRATFSSLLTYLHLSTDHDPRSGLEPAVFELRISIHIPGVWTLVDGVNGRS
jgi:hypothetical protein